MLRAASSRPLFAVLLLAACGDDTTLQPTASGTTEATTSPLTTTGDPPAETSEPTSDQGEVSTSPAETSTTPPTSSTGDTTTTGPVDPTADTSTSTSTDETTTSSSTTTTGAEVGETDGCTPGDVGCECDADNECVPEGTCWLGLCEKNGGNICPYEFDGYCNEGDAICPEGSDPHDCCAEQGNGICEEVGMGGVCAVGTDVFDCGGCEYVNDGYCDEPFLCPPGSDKPDCCATEENGICEEEGMGGECPDGSDPFDCGECPYTNDGYCDEPQLCAEGTDVDDCCATEQDGICEEVDQGGVCPEGTDWIDCGECQWANDGECDEPFLCPEGTDGDDCP